jgi:RNA recognition motif-containing protein
MSNATQNSRNSGDSRRRRSRGGQNRRNNDNNSERHSNEGRTEGRQSDGRQSGGGRREGAARTGGRQDTGKPQRRPMPAPIQLSWWQKLLKSVGLYKEPVRPPRPERRPDAVEPAKTREPRRNQTRDARTENRGNRSESQEGQPAREGRGNRRERGDRGERDGGRRGGDPSSVENRRVYVGNLSYETTESDLEELFKGVGAVRRIEIVYNRNTHRSKGYGFVEMLDIDEAKRTVEVLHDQFFMGRKLTVSGAKSQEHEAAESEESAPESRVQAMPALAPLPPKEEVLDLVSELKGEETLAEVIEEEPHAEIPTEEFHETAETLVSEEETEQRPNA